MWLCWQTEREKTDGLNIGIKGEKGAVGNVGKTWKTEGGGVLF